MTRIVDYRRALPLPNEEQRNRWCAIIELQGGSAVGACHLRLPLTAGCERRDADDVPPFAERCQRCHVVVMQHALLRSIDHSAAKACRPQPQSFVEFAAGFPGFPTSLLAVATFASVDDLAASELERLRRLAAPAYDAAEAMAAPQLPRTTAVDLPYDVSDCGSSEAKS